MSQLWRNGRRSLQAGILPGFVFEPPLFGSIFERARPMKIIFRLMGILLKRHVVLTPYRRAAKRRNAGALKMSSVHTRNFGLKRKPDFASDASAG